MDVALEAAQELHRVQSSNQVTLRNPSTTNQKDHEAVFLTIFNRAIQWEKAIPYDYRTNSTWLDAYRQGRRDGLHAFMIKRFPYLFENTSGDEVFDGMWVFCVSACNGGSMANQEVVQNDLEAMMKKISLGTENIQGLMTGIDWDALMGSRAAGSEMDMD